MARQPRPELDTEAELLGILLAGGFGTTRVECSPAARLRLELRESGVHRLTPPATVWRFPAAPKLR